MAAANEGAIQRDQPLSAVSTSAPAQAVGSGPPDLKAVAQAKSEAPPDQKLAVGDKPGPTKRSFAAELLQSMLRRLATLVISLLALLIAIVTWDQYVTSPWTRDGRVRVQVASVAPEVSGRIIELRIADNQFVHKGDILYQIDPFDFDVALDTNRAFLRQREADLHVKKLQAERRLHLSDLATTPEEQQVFEGNSIQAKAAVDAAQQQVAQAEINRRRTEVRSPVNGYVTNLLLRQGDYAHVGVTNVSVIDTDSFWIDGYFEETKLARICVGDRAEAKLMGYATPIIGHVTTVTRGLSVSDAAPGTQGLPNVDPVYTWVRLAQRVPIRIAIDKVPQGVPLISGTTATVTIRGTSEFSARSWFDRGRDLVESSLSDVMSGASPQPDCIAVNPR